jgi:hypothetical protein
MYCNSRATPLDLTDFSNENFRNWSLGCPLNLILQFYVFLIDNCYSGMALKNPPKTHPKKPKKNT